MKLDVIFAMIALPIGGIIGIITALKTSPTYGVTHMLYSALLFVFAGLAVRYHYIFWIMMFFMIVFYRPGTIQWSRDKLNPLFLRMGIRDDIKKE